MNAPQTPNSNSNSNSNSNFGSGSGSALERPHVLIITADPDLKTFLGEGLVLGGFWTSTVASALQALEVFRLRSFDLVLLDADLPGLGATELVRRLRGRSDRAPGGARTDVPLLAVAADAGSVDPAALAAAGADGLLTAPLELEDLVPYLHAVFRDWRSAHPGRPMADQAAQQRPVQERREERGR